MAIGETDSYVQIYREENGLSSNADNAYVVVNDRDLSLKKDDINNICKHFKTDYVIYTRVTSSQPRFSGGFMSASHAVEKGLKKGLKEIEKDSLKIKTSMTD